VDRHEATHKAVDPGGGLGELEAVDCREHALLSDSRAAAQEEGSTKRERSSAA
jgi:hypothetical protein